MKRIITGFLVTLSVAGAAQERCHSSNYREKTIASDPAVASRVAALETFTSTLQSNISSRNFAAPNVIRIPVVFHVLYHVPGENISDQRIQEQLDIINRDFRRRNSDTANAPSYFRMLGADMQIEFALAKSDPQGRSTTGINRRYTAVGTWMTDDKMKFNAEYGLDAWDTKSYLNIWICNLKDALGYSAFPGTEEKLDGVVIDYRVVGKNGPIAQYNLGRTAVHEVAHWLNLRHIWGDAFCGDDGVDDTPKQMSYTPGCPNAVRSTCNNGPQGDMYMNYMDFTGDACMNMFTVGQKQRAHALFVPGGPRYSLLWSKGFNEPTVQQGTLPDFYPKWLEARVYPNPTRDRINIYFEYDERWIGQPLTIMDVNGRNVHFQKITARVQSIDVSRLQSGIYFIKTEKAGETIIKKFVKL